MCIYAPRIDNMRYDGMHIQNRVMQKEKNFFLVRRPTRQMTLFNDRREFKLFELNDSPYLILPDIFR